MEITDEKIKRAMKRAEWSEILMIALITALEYAQKWDTTPLENNINQYFIWN